MNDLLSHLWPWTEDLRESINQKDYDKSFKIIENIEKTRDLSKKQIEYLNKVKEEITIKI